MNYFKHFTANMVVAFRCLILFLFHFFHAVFPTKYTSHEFYKFGMFRKLLIIISISFAACSTPETIIKELQVEITVPAIKDSISSSFINISPVQIDTLKDVFKLLPDSAKFEGVKEIKTAKGDKLKVKVAYFPKQNSFTIDIPSYIIDKTIIDTTQVVIKEKTFFEKIKYWFCLAVVVVFVIIIIKIWRFKIS